jgi:type I restriction enzyme M protein
VKKGNGSKHSNGDTALNFGAQLWAAADRLRGHMEASDYKHVAVGLIFHKYISDASVVRIQSSNGGERHRVEEIGPK